uniref:Uncharacterized protein n=2 Tax=Leersia perrieri TaxID=77586 RepID=A0A0D9W041_9ORYZ
MPLLRRMSSLRVPAMSPIELGRQPPRRGRFASTITDAVELVKLAGSLKSKLLLLMNSASIFFSNIASGTSPHRCMYIRILYVCSYVCTTRCVPEVDVFEVREAEELRGEGSRQMIIADVNLMEAMEVTERVGEGSGESVGVEVEHGEVGEEADLLGQRAGEVAVVEVDAGDRSRARVVGRRRAVHAEVVADVGPAPAVRQVLRVVGDRPLQRLQRHVRTLQPRVVRRRRRRRRRR